MQAITDDQATSAMEIYRRWNDGFVFRKMRLHEVRQVKELVGGVRPISCELDVLIKMHAEDSHVDGFYVVELDGEIVA